MKKRLLLTLVFLKVLTSLVAQDSIPAHSSVRLEFGLGPGIAGFSPGLSGRAAFSVIVSNWGGMIRYTVRNGEEGIDQGGFLHMGPPKELFNDNAILVSRVIKNRKYSQFIASVGYGKLYGEKLNDSKTDLVSISHQPGFAYELSIATTKTAIGCSFSIIGNINSERNVFAIMLSLTIGFQK